MKQRLRTLLFCTLVVPLIQCTSSKPGGPATEEFARSSFAPYWYTDEQTTSTIEIKNVLDTEVMVLPVLTTSAGDRVKLDPVTISPHGLRRVPIAAEYFRSAAQGRSSNVSQNTRWGNGSLPGSQTGGAELRVLHPDNAGSDNLAAWILIENPARGLGLVTTFHSVPVDDGFPNEFNGVWWLPSGGTRAYYALQNAYGEDLEMRMTLTADDAVFAEKSIDIPAGQSHLVDIRSLIESETAAPVGGIKIHYEPRPGERGGLLGRGIIVDESRGFTTPLNLYKAKGEAGKRQRTELHAPLAYFGRLGYLVPESTDIITPYLLVSNTSDEELVVNGAVRGTSPDSNGATFYLDTIPLPAYSSRVIDLGKLRDKNSETPADGVAGLELWHQQGPNDVIAELINVSDSWDMALYDRTTNTSLHDSTDYAAISLRLDAAAHSFLVLKNTTNQVQRPEVLLDVDSLSEHYSVPNVEIPPRQVKVIDIKALRDQQVEGDFGVVLPKNAEHVSARIIGEPGAIVGSDPSVVFKENQTVIDYAPSCLVLVSHDPLGGGGSSPSTCRIRDLAGSPKVSKSFTETMETPLEKFTWKGALTVNRTSATTISSAVTGSLTKQSDSTEVVKVSVRGTVMCNAECRPELKCSTPDCDDMSEYCIDGNCGPQVANPRKADAIVLILSGDSVFNDQIPIDYVTFGRTHGPDFDDRNSTNVDKVAREYRCKQQ